MPTLILEDFKIGLDRRRMNETSLPGSLVKCQNAHITRGGEIEKSEAFIRFCNLPANTFGLKALAASFAVFGSDNITPTILSTNPPVRYQRLDDGSANMIEIHSVDLFDGIPYVAAEYDDGIIRHFYDGVKVAEQFSGKARAKFTLNGTTAAAAVAASGSFIIQNPEDGCSISSILVDVVQLLSGTVTFDEETDRDGFPLKVVDAINANSNISGFYAEILAGSKVVIKAQIAGAAVNGDAVVVTEAGPVIIQSETAMAGGVDAKQVTSITVNAVEIMPTDVDWAESNQQTAAAVASSINDYTATSGYEAFAYGSTVLIRSTTDGIAPNGHLLVVTADPEIPIVGASASMQGGSASPTVIDPGRFVKTFKNKMYTLSGPSVYYSALDDPDDFSGTGSGFDNLSNNASGAEVLTAMASYFENMAIFSRNNIQIWFMSDDPDENQRIQLLNNTGTVAPDSVTEYGENDVFYLSESGIRSLRARDTTNAAFVNDVGIAIDPLIQNELLTNNVKAEKAKGFLEPREGRFQMVIGETIYVFSFFPSSKISAWSTYLPGFEIVARPASIGQTIVCRSGNALYKVGSSVRREYDSRQVKVMTPFLAAGDPTLVKQWTGLDMACQGTWDVYISTDPLRVDSDGMPDEEYFEKIGSITNTTYAETGGENGHMGFDAISSHIALMFICRSSGYARIGNCAMHYAAGGEKQ